MQPQAALGVFDSGLGGLTVLRRLRTLLPAQNLVYFADQRHVPYGDRSDAELRALLGANVAYLASCGVAAIVMGCNTSCAIAARYGWPRTDLKIFDLIDAVAEAVSRSPARRIGVLATAATARSGAYGAAIRARCPGIDVREAAAPALVPLVEQGALRGPQARAAVADACASLGPDRDALVLACTHFPLLDETFQEVVGNIPRIDPAEVQARRAAAWVCGRGNTNGSARGRTRYLTNGAIAAFRANIARLMGPLDEFEDVEEQKDAQAAECCPGDDLSDRMGLQIHP